MIEVPGTDLARDAVRQFNKRLFNPVVLRVAGRRYWYAAVVRHTGRRSGTAYATPVVADAIRGGFLVPLPYGRDVDWLRNVLAAGQATLVVHGHSYPVTRPRGVPAAEALPLLTGGAARRRRLWRTEHFLRVTARPDLRAGDPQLHDLVAELDEAIDAGDEARVEQLGRRLHAAHPNAGAGADT